MSVMAVYPTDTCYSGSEMDRFALRLPHRVIVDKVQILHVQMAGIMIQPNMVLKEVKI